MGAGVTMDDVASACGLSRMTVSNAYNRPDQLSAESRRRVLEAAARLGYRGPSAAGRLLRLGRSEVLGVLLSYDLPSAFGDPGTMQFLHGVTAGAAEAGKGLQLMPAMGADAVALVRHAAIDGLIAFATPRDDRALAVAVDRGLPLVVAGGTPVAGRPWVGIDNTAAAAAVVEHLIGLGHRRLGMVSMPLHQDGRTGPVDEIRLRSAPYAVARDRTTGAARAVGSVDGATLEITEPEGNTVAAGREAARALLGGAARPTAVVAATDVLAIGVLEAAAELGVAVPQQLSVTGIDDIDEASRTSPALTTIHQSLYDQGQLSARLLTGGAAPRRRSRRWSPSSLVVRGSTARLAAS